MKDKKKVSIIVGVFLLVLITIGVTYAFFSYIGTGSTENTISSDSITFLYEEIDQQGSGIGITDAIPVEDSTGMQGQAFNFRIISNTNSNISIPYEITVRQKPGTDDIGDIVKLYLTKVDNNNNEEEVELSKYNELRTVTKNNHQEKLLHTDKVPARDSEYNQRYRLRMWIDNSTNLSAVTTPAHCSKGENITTQEACEALEPAGTWIPESTTYPYNNKTFAVTVNVYSTGHVQTQQDIEAASRIDITSFSVNNTVLTGNNNLYEMELPVGTTETTINVETANPYTKAVIEKTDETYTNVVSMNNVQKLSTSKKVSLGEGYNYFRIRLTSEDTTTNSELHLKISLVNYTLYTQDFGENGRTVDQNNPLSVSFTNNTSKTSRTYELVAELPAGTSGKGFMSFGGSNAAGGAISFSLNNFSGYSNGFVFGAANNVTLSSGKHHYAMVLTTTETKLYEDGVLKFTGNPATNLMKNSTNFKVGYNESSNTSNWSGGTLYSFCVTQNELAPGSFILGN